ncbi:MAG TPA: porin PorA family protein, partial [Mycobacteriales bacterium]|nr:porin PorA family protein [Mycobacteriales bacterium]
TLRNSRGEDKVTVVGFDLTFDEPTQRAQADLARDGIDKIRLVSLWLPLFALFLGLIFVIAGSLLMRGPDRGGDGPATREGEDEPVPVGGPGPAEDR